MRNNDDERWFSGCDQDDPWGDSHPTWRSSKKTAPHHKESPFDGKETEQKPVGDTGSTRPAAKAFRPEKQRTDPHDPIAHGKAAANFKGSYRTAPVRPKTGIQRNPRPFNPVIFAVMMVLIFLIGGFIAGVSEIFEGTKIPDLPQNWEWEWGDDEDDDDDGYHFDVERNDEADEDYSIAPYQGDASGLTIPLKPKAGKTAMDFETLYEQCLPSTASITVYAGSSAAYGSGVVLTEDGFILTCAHVTDDMESCTVTVSNGETYAALMVGSDDQTDLAVLKIDAKGLKAAEFGDSNDLKIGETACAIGDSLGIQFQGTLTNGIVSGLNREISSNGYGMVLLQTTAAVNSGNSGGALFNKYGQVIGIVNMKMSNPGTRGPTIDNMGLAVPSATVKDVVESLAANGSIDRAVLGITCFGINTTSSTMSGLPEGLWVTSIQDGSLCEEGGLMMGDIITAVNGHDVVSVAEFKKATDGYVPGDTVTLTVWRDEELAQRVSELEDYEDLRDLEDDAETEYNFEYFGEIEVELVSSSDLE